MTEVTGNCIGRHREPVPAAAGVLLCESCIEAAERDVRALLWDYLDLANMLVPGSSTGSKVSGTRDAPVPVALGVDELMSEIDWLTTTWGTVVRERAGLVNVPDRGIRRGWAVQQAVSALSPRVRLLAGIGATAVWPDGPQGVPADVTGAEALLAMSRLHQRARFLLGRTRLVEELLGECSGCGLNRVLRTEAGSDTVWCSNCDARWTRGDYEKYVKLLAWGEELVA